MDHTGAEFPGNSGVTLRHPQLHWLTGGFDSLVGRGRCKGTRGFGEKPCACLGRPMGHLFKPPHINKGRRIFVLLTPSIPPGTETSDPSMGHLLVVQFGYSDWRGGSSMGVGERGCDDFAGTANEEGL